MSDGKAGTIPAFGLTGNSKAHSMRVDPLNSGRLSNKAYSPASVACFQPTRLTLVSAQFGELAKLGAPTRLAKLAILQLVTSYIIVY